MTLINTRTCCILFFILFQIEIFSYTTTTNVYVDPPSLTTSSTGTVSLNFKISNVSNLKSYSIEFKFDNSIVSLSNVTKSSFLTNGSNSTVLLTQPTLENVTNSVTVSEAILGLGNYPSGSGQLFTAQFNVISAGTSIIQIESVTLYDLNNQVIPSTFNSGQIIVLLSLDAKVFLHGPYSGGAMNTTLLSKGKIPLNQPYSSSYWDYHGTENLTTVPPGVVDWVLLELREGTSLDTRKARRAALLLSNGKIVDLDGTSNVHFDVAAGNYFVVIYHRNHLAIMSASSIPLDVTSSQYDFSSAQSKAWGDSPMIYLAPGIYGMIAGDANADGLITGTDFNLFNPKFRQAASGYEQTDWNLDGIISGTDFNYFNPNYRTAKKTQVPH